MLKKSLIAATAALTLSAGASAAEDIDIVFVGKNTGNPYFDSLTQGFVDACEVIACNFEFVAPATAEATSQIPFLEAQIQRGVDVIAISPNSPDALNQVFQSARDAGIIVLTVNGDITGNEQFRDATILPTDFTKVGADQIEMVGSLIGYEGEIAAEHWAELAPEFLSVASDLLEQLKRFSRATFPAEAFGSQSRPRSQIGPQALIIEEAVYCRSDLVWIRRVHQQGCIAGEFAKPKRIGRYNGSSTSQRLCDGNRERLHIG